MYAVKVVPITRYNTNGTIYGITDSKENMQDLVNEIIGNYRDKGYKVTIDTCSVELLKGTSHYAILVDVYEANKKDFGIKLNDLELI